MLNGLNGYKAKLFHNLFFIEFIFKKFEILICLQDG